MEITNKINLKIIKVNNKGEEKKIEKRIRIDKVYFEIEEELNKKAKHYKNYYLLNEEELNVLIDISKQLNKELIVVNEKPNEEGTYYQFNFKDERLVFQENYSDKELLELTSNNFIKRQLKSGKDFEKVLENNSCELFLKDPITEELLIKIKFSIKEQKIIFSSIVAYNCEEYIKNLKFILNRLKAIKKYRYNKKNSSIL